MKTVILLGYSRLFSNCIVHRFHFIEPVVESENKNKIFYPFIQVSA